MKRIALAAAFALLIPGLAEAADISGAWKIDTDVGGMPLTISCNITQAGAALSGKCGLAGDSQTSSFTGTIDGAAAKWAYDVDFGGQTMHVVYTAQVEDKAMKGSMEVAGMSGPFTGAKQ